MEENSNFNKNTETDNDSEPSVIYWTRSGIENQPRVHSMNYH